MKEGVTIRVYVLVTLLAVLLALLSCSEPEDEKTDALKSSPAPSTAKTHPETPSPILTPLVPTATSISPTVKPKPDLVLKAFPTHNEPLPTDWGRHDASLSSGQYLIMVELEAEKGCLRAAGFDVFNQGKPPSYLLIWPDGFEATAAGGDIHVRDRAGKIVASVGDVVRLSGRLVWPWKDGQSETDHSREIARSAPDECRGPYYLIGDDITVMDDDEPEIVSPPGSGLYFQRYKTERWGGGILQTLEELFPGVFHITRDNNCIVMIDTQSQEKYVPQWPAGFYPSVNSEGRFEVRNGGGRSIVQEGGRLWMSRSSSRENYIPECDARLWYVRAVSDPDFPIALPISPKATQGEDYTGGNLEVHNGCVYLGSRILIFPPNFSIRREGEEVHVIDERGVAVAREGQHTTLRGSWVNPDDNFGREVRKSLPLDCPHGGFWLLD